MKGVGMEYMIGNCYNMYTKGDDLPQRIPNRPKVLYLNKY